MGFVRKGQLPHEQFTIEGRMCRTGTATIYRARSPSGSPLVVKRIDHPYARYEEVEAMRAVQGVKGFVQLEHSQTEADGKLCIVMSMYHSDVLTHVVDLDVRRRCDMIGFARRVMLDIAPALVYLHRDVRMVHLDIKPDNILWDANDERYVLCDFGWAHRLDEEGRGIINEQVGTEQYVAPELCGADDVSYRRVCERSDAYSLGVTAYAITTGRYPRTLDPTELVKEMTRHCRNSGDVVFARDIVGRWLDPRLESRESIASTLKYLESD